MFLYDEIALLVEAGAKPNYMGEVGIEETAKFTLRSAMVAEPGCVAAIPGGPLLDHPENAALITWETLQ